MKGNHVDDVDTIDRAIDQAARAMTAGEPGPAFSARVMARVQRRPTVWNWRWGIAPVSVVAATAIIVFALRMPSRNVRPAPSPAEGALSSSRGALSPPSRGALSPSRGALSPSGEALSPSARLKPSRSAAPPSFVATLAPAPLDVPSMALPEIDSASSLDVPAIATPAPMTVAPLDQPQGDHP